MGGAVLTGDCRWREIKGSRCAATCLVVACVATAERRSWRWRMELMGGACREVREGALGWLLLALGPALLLLGYTGLAGMGQHAEEGKREDEP